jgi:hypothetical protein
MTNSSKIYIYIFLILLLAVVLGKDCNAQTTNYQAYSLFTYNFMKYTKWPEKEGNLIVTIVGKTKVAGELAALSQTKTVEGKKIEVNAVDNIESGKYSHIIFVADGKSGSIKEIVEKTKGQATLVITEREGLTGKGACISFLVMENGSLRFQVNDQELSSRNIQLANVIMSLAQKN